MTYPSEPTNESRSPEPGRATPMEPTGADRSMEPTGADRAETGTGDYQPARVGDDLSADFSGSGESNRTAATSYKHVAAELGVDRESVLAREQERFGGIKFGSAFFGWLTATGMAVLLGALLAAAGVVLTSATGTSAAQITNEAAGATGAARTVGLVGAILLLVILFVSYFCGGYVAGRMSRFDGLKQGLAVWVWGVAIIIIIALLALIFGDQFNILPALNLPSIPLSAGDRTGATIIAAVAAVLVTLGGAILGGLSGMRFHRKVDKAGYAA